MALVKLKRSPTQIKSHRSGKGTGKDGGLLGMEGRKRSVEEKVIRIICVYMKLSENKINSQEKKMKNRQLHKDNLKSDLCHYILMG